MQSTPRLIVVSVPFTQKINDDAGSGAHQDLQTWKPASLDRNWYYLGPVATNNNEAPIGLIVREMVPGTLVDIDSWGQVWNDKGSGKSTDYALWRGACRNPNYISLASYFTRNYDAPSADETKGMKAVNRDVLIQAVADYQIWTDAGSGAKADGAVWHVSSGGNENVVETGAFVAVNGYDKPPADAYGINTSFT